MKVDKFLDKDVAAVLQDLPDAVIAVDDQGSVRFLNAAAETLTGYSDSELFGLGIEELVPISRRDVHVRHRSQYTFAPVQREMYARGDLSLRRKDGILVPVAINLNPRFDANRKVILCTIRDVSDQERRSREDMLFAEIGVLVSKQPDLKSLFDVLDGSLPILIQFDRLVVTVKIPGTDLLERIHVSGLHVDEETHGTLIPGPDENAVSVGLLPGTVISNYPPANDQVEVHLAEAGLRSWMQVPLGSPDDPSGYLSLRSTEPDAYELADLSLLERIALQITPGFEIARLSDQTHREGQERSILASISRLITSKTDIQDVYSKIAENIRDLIPFDRIVVSTVDRSRNLVTDRYVGGLQIDGGESGNTYPLDNSLTGKLISDPEPRTLSGDDTYFGFSDQPSKLRREAGLRSLLCVPLIWNDDAIGVLIFRALKDQTYGVAESELAKRISAQISGAVANAELVHALERDIVIQDALSEISRTITSKVDITQVYSDVADEVSKLIPFDRIVVSTLNSSQNRVMDRYVAGLQLEGGEVGNSYDIDDVNISHLITDPKPRFYTGDQAERMFGGQYKASNRRKVTGLKAVITVPIIWNDEVIGQLKLHSSQESPYGLYQAELAQKVADQISGAVANAELVAKLEHEISVVEALAAISRTVTESPNTDLTIPELAKGIRRLMALDRLVIHEVDENSQTFKLRWSWGGDNGPLQFGVPSKLAESITGEVVASRSVTIYRKSDVNRIKSYVKSRGGDPNPKLNSWIASPLIAGGRCIGVLHIRAQDPNAYSDNEIRFTEMIAAQIAGALSISGAHERTLKSEQARASAEADKQRLEGIESQREFFLSTVSHELKTPLTSLVAFADILSKNRDSNLSDRQINEIEVMRRSARRLDVLINDLVDVSQLEAGNLALEIKEFDFQVLVDEIVQDIGPVLRLKHQSLETLFECGQASVCGDRGRLTQVISNLLSNASKYSSDGSEIVMSVACGNGALILTVEDHGIGISDLDQKELFTPFFRSAGNETQAEQGTGLGLFIVKNFIELHHGTVTVVSEEGIGTTVSITISECTDDPHLGAHTQPTETGFGMTQSTSSD